MQVDLISISTAVKLYLCMLLTVARRNTNLVLFVWRLIRYFEYFGKCLFLHLFQGVIFIFTRTFEFSVAGLFGFMRLP